MYDIVRYEARYKDDVVKLLEPLWGPDKAQGEAYLTWKYLDNPYESSQLIYMALYEGQVVGTDSYSVSCWQASEREQKYLCVQGGDAVVHPDHRRRGLHNKIKLMALKELEGGAYHSEIVMGANLSTTGSNLKAGGTSVVELKSMDWRACADGGRLHRMARKLLLLPGALSHFPEDKTVRPPAEPSYNPFHTLDENCEKTRERGRSHVVLQETPDPAAMAALVESQPYDGRIRHVRDEHFYAWRYKNPLSAFRFLLWRNNGSLQGYLVLQRSVIPSSNTAVIVDWEATGPEVFSDLVKAAIEQGGFSSMSIWSITLSDEFIRILKKHGFSIPTETPAAAVTAFCPRLLVIPLRAKEHYTMGERKLLDLKNWDLRPIYSDTY